MTTKPLTPFQKKVLKNFEKGLKIEAWNLHNMRYETYSYAQNSKFESVNFNQNCLKKLIEESYIILDKDFNWVYNSERNTYWIDPPSGWQYGFPKEYAGKDFPDTQWFLDKGYPQREIDQGMLEHTRMWLKTD